MEEEANDTQPEVKRAENPEHDVTTSAGADERASLNKGSRDDTSSSVQKLFELGLVFDEVGFRD